MDGLTELTNLDLKPSNHMKMFRYLIAFGVIIQVGCNYNYSRTSQKVNIDKLYIAKTSSDSLALKFKSSSDSVYILYYFTLDYGNRLNYPLDTIDFAGSFKKDSVKGNKVTVSVKDYREFWNDSSKVYDVVLDFISDSTIRWFIDSNKYGNLDNLPNLIYFNSAK